jgi:HEAT repeat protein
VPFNLTAADKHHISANFLIIYKNMKRVYKTILFLFLTSVFAGGALYSAEKDPKEEIFEIMRGILREQSKVKKAELANRLGLYPYEDVSECWVDLLEKASQPDMILEIINYLSAYNDKRFVMPIANQLVSPYIAVRKTAGQILKRMGDDRLYPVILKIADSANPVHRIYFIEAMNFLYDRRFFASLTNMLRDENKSVRIYVLNCLKENRVAESLPLIRNAALSDKNDQVRIIAIEVLGAFRDVGAAPALHMILYDRNREIRLESVRSLSRIGAATTVHYLSLRLLAEDDLEIKERLVESLAALKRVGDIRGLEKILLTDGNEGLKIKSAYVLGFSGGQAALSALLQGLKDSDYRVRAEICNSLGNFRNKLALAGLLEALARDETTYVKSASLYAIKRMNDRSSVSALFDLYVGERDPVLKEMLREVVRDCIKRYL